MAMLVDSTFSHVDKLTYEIFSILETNFLFGNNNGNKDKDQQRQQQQQFCLSNHNTFNNINNKDKSNKVRILSIDGEGATSGILAATSLAHFESFLKKKSGNPNASVSDFFDVVAGAGTGGILAALLFTRGKDGRPMFTASGALDFMVRNRRKIRHGSPEKGLFRRVFASGKKGLEKLLKSTFGDATLRDTLKSVLIPCYDMSTRAPFVFSRADAVETDGFDFKMADVCIATSASRGVVQLNSVNKRRSILAVDGGVAMNNPTAAAITHVLNNKQEYPLCNGVEDLLLVSLGNGESNTFHAQSSPVSSSKTLGFTSIACDASSDMVDQAVSMAFGLHRTSNYARVQAMAVGRQVLPTKNSESEMLLAMAEEMLSQKNVESVLFQGKKVSKITNMEKLELFAGEVLKEDEKRKTCVLPPVLLKQVSPFSPPRSSSATIASTFSSSC